MTEMETRIGTSQIIRISAKKTYDLSLDRIGKEYIDSMDYLYTVYGNRQYCRRSY